MITKERIAEILFEYDPANLDCKANDMFDEYAPEAEEILRKLKVGKLVIDAVNETFDNAFSGTAEVPFEVIAEIEADMI